MPSIEDTSNRRSKMNAAERSMDAHKARVGETPRQFIDHLNTLDFAKEKIRSDGHFFLFPDGSKIKYDDKSTFTIEENRKNMTKDIKENKLEKLVNHIKNSDANNISKSIASILREKIGKKLAERKLEISKSMFDKR